MNFVNLFVGFGIIVVGLVLMSVNIILGLFVTFIGFAIGINPKK